MEKSFFVYMLASGPNGTLYIGVTSDLRQRIWQHREGLTGGFTQEYGVKQLVWYELQADALTAIQREKQLKRWNRAWKIALIEQGNPQWLDLFDQILQ